MLHMLYFRDVFMCIAFPTTPAWNNKCAIVDLDESGSGIHWVCNKLRGYRVLFFDGKGNLRRLVELMKYFGNKLDIRYNYDCK